MVWEKEKIVGSCLVGGAAFAVGASFLHLFLKGELPLGLGLGSGLPWCSFRKRKPVRVYMNGCFDMMHYGHFNALRQARALGDQLVVGVVSDEEIIANKGPPVTPLHERMIMVKAIKWVDEVIPDAPYAITEDFMKKLFDEYQIDYIIHGDDPCVLPGGTDAYALAKKAGRYKQIKRTEGVSSTDGRMLLCVRERSVSDSHSHSSLQRQFSHGHNGPKFEDGASSAGTRVSHFLPTSRRIVQFSNGKSKEEEQVVMPPLDDLEQVVMLPLDEPLIRAMSMFTYAYPPLGIPYPVYAEANTLAIMDLENNGVPTGVDGSLAGPAIRAYLEQLGYHGPLEMHGWCAVRDVVGAQREKQLRAGGVEYHCLNLEEPEDDASDNAIKQMINDWTIQNPSPGNIFLIASDNGFAEDLLGCYHNGYNILIAYINDCAGKGIKKFPGTTCHWTRRRPI